MALKLSLNWKQPIKQPIFEQLCKSKSTQPEISCSEREEKSIFIHYQLVPLTTISMSGRFIRWNCFKILTVLFWEWYYGFQWQDQEEKNKHKGTEKLISDKETCDWLLQKVAFMLGSELAETRSQVGSPARTAMVFSVGFPKLLRDRKNTVLRVCAECLQVFQSQW